MRNKIKILIVYFPIILVALQVLVNTTSLIWPQMYYGVAFYLNVSLGTNILFAFFLVAFTQYFKFCSVSKWAAIAELLFAINYTIVKEDNMYNIVFQIIVGVIGLLLTFKQYISKFPLCRFSLFVGFVASAIKKGSCKKGLEEWDRNVKSILLKQNKQDARHIR